MDRCQYMSFRGLTGRTLSRWVVKVWSAGVWSIHRKRPYTLMFRLAFGEVKSWNPLPGVNSPAVVFAIGFRMASESARLILGIESAVATESAGLTTEISWAAARAGSSPRAATTARERRKGVPANEDCAMRLSPG